MYKIVKDIPLTDRPFEKLIRYGPEKLEDYELMAVILRKGTKGEGIINLSKKILNNIKDYDITKIKYENFNNIKGIGPVKRSQIISCLELGKRLFQLKKIKLFIKPNDIFNDLKDIRNAKKEYFVVFFLDSRNQEIKRETVSIGSINASIAHPREVFEAAIKYSAFQIILAHNHPSMNFLPSQEDIQTTKNLVKAGNIIGIEVIDHIIVTNDNYYSFKENNLI